MDSSSRLPPTRTLLHTTMSYMETMAASVVSAFAAFLPPRPSQMPNAGGHSLGNANLVKASVLSAYLRGSVLPTLLDAVGAR